MRLTLIFLFCIFSSTVVNPQLTPQVSGSKASLRGVSAISSSIAWASGTHGTCLRTTDGGVTWKQLTIPGAEALDFRDVKAFDANTAYLLSIGEGESSRIYKTTDAGQHWNLTFTNHNPKAFFDALAFWDVNNGLALSDPVDGHFIVIKTTDGGANWQAVPPANIPPAVASEGAFAASGTCIIAHGTRNAWFVTGGGAARVFRSTDQGNTWQVAATPIISGVASAGIFSIAFKDDLNGVIIGGNYKKETEARDNLALTTDGGQTWRLIKADHLGGYRSAVAYAPGAKSVEMIAVGTSGADYSSDGGKTWTSLGTAGYNAFGFAPHTDVGWAAGEGGRIAKFAYGFKDGSVIK